MIETLYDITPALMLGSFISALLSLFLFSIVDGIVSCFHVDLSKNPPLWAKIFVYATVAIFTLLLIIHVSSIAFFLTMKLLIFLF